MPDAGEARDLAATFVEKSTKPGSRFSELAGARLVTAHPLIFRARRDDRPLLLHQFAVCAEAELNGKTEWWLMSYYRHPSSSGPGEWRLSNQRGMHSPLAFRRLTAKPTAEDVEEFLAWIGWDARFPTFRDVEYLCFASGWHAVTGAAPPPLPGANVRQAE